MNLNTINYADLDIGNTILFGEKVKYATIYWDFVEYIVRVNDINILKENAEALYTSNFENTSNEFNKFCDYIFEKYESFDSYNLEVFTLIIKEVDTIIYNQTK